MSSFKPQKSGQFACPTITSGNDLATLASHSGEATSVYLQVESASATDLIYIGDASMAATTDGMGINNSGFRTPEVPGQSNKLDLSQITLLAASGHTVSYVIWD